MDQRLSFSSHRLSEQNPLRRTYSQDRETFWKSAAPTELLPKPYATYYSDVPQTTFSKAPTEAVGFSSDLRQTIRTNEYERQYIEEASKYRQLKSDFDCLNDVYQKLQQRSQVEISQYKQFIQTLEQEIQSLKRQLRYGNELHTQSSFIFEENQLKREAQAVSSDDLVISEAKARLRAMNEEKITLMNKINDQNRIIVELEERVTFLSRQNSQIQIEHETRLETVTRQNRSLQTEITTLQARLNEANAVRNELALKEAEIGRLRTEVVTVRSQPQIVHEKITHVENPALRSEINIRLGEIDNLRNELRLKDIEISNLRNQGPIIQERVVKVDDPNLRNELLSKVSELSNLKQDLFSKENEIGRLNTEINRLKNQPPVYQERVIKVEDPSLKNELINKNLEIDGLKSEIFMLRNRPVQVRVEEKIIEKEDPRLRTELNDRCNEIERLKKELVLAKNQPPHIQIHEKVVEVENPHLRSEIEEKNREITQLKNELSILKDKPSQIQIQERIIEREDPNLKKKIEEKQFEIENLKMELGDLRSRPNVQVVEKIVKVEDHEKIREIEYLQNQLRELQNRPPQVKIEERIIETESPQLQSELHDKMSEITRLNNEIVALKSRQPQIQEKILQVESPQLLEENRDLRRQLEHLRSELLAAQAKGPAPVEKYITVEDASLRNQLQNKQLEIERLNRELSQIRSKTTRENLPLQEHQNSCQNCPRKDVTISYLNSQLNKEIPSYPLQRGGAEHSLTIRCNCTDQRLFQHGKHISIISNCLHKDHSTNAVTANDSYVVQDNGTLVNTVKLQPNETILLKNEEPLSQEPVYDHSPETDNKDTKNDVFTGDMSIRDGSRYTFGGSNNHRTDSRNSESVSDRAKIRSNSSGRTESFNSMQVGNSTQDRNQSVNKYSQIVGLSHYAIEGKRNDQFFTQNSQPQTPRLTMTPAASNSGNNGAKRYSISANEYFN